MPYQITHEQFRRIKKLFKLGNNTTQIALRLELHKETVRKYKNMNEEEFIEKYRRKDIRYAIRYKNELGSVYNYE